uniref:NEDD4 binding protein 2 n=1 Tax=Iconisemion striatum TaxID=60296 RepID=A0A1A7XDY5_9TELE
MTVGMPRKRKSGQSPARLPAGPPEGGSHGHNTSHPLPQTSHLVMASNFHTSSAEKERIVKSMQEMFSHLDPDVIHIVLSECDFKVENAMDSLLELSRAAEVVTPNPLPVSGFERTAAALLSPRHFSELKPEAHLSSPLQQSSSPLSTNLLTEELDLLIDPELETLATQQEVKQEQHGSLSLCAEATFSTFPPLPVPQQTLPELLQTSLGARSGEPSPLNQLGTWEYQSPEMQNDVLDFTHLMTEASPDKSKPPLDLVASGRPSAFQVYKKQDPSCTPSEMTESNDSVSGTRSQENPSSHPHSYMSVPWNLAPPVFSPHFHGNQRPAFITPVAQTPSVWFGHMRHASPWMNQGPVSQAPLRPASAAVPMSWVLPAAPQTTSHSSRLHLQGKLLVLLRGAPGSGKSSLARAMLEQNPGGVVLSTDDYFTCDGRYRFDPMVLGEAHEWNHKRAKEAFQRGTNPIIIDNTNMQGWEMKPYVAQALRHGYKVLFREPDTWWKNKPKELERRSTHNIPVETICRMLNGYERFVTVQSIMGSQMPEIKRRPLQELRSPLSVNPDLVGQPALMEQHKKPQLFSSLPDVSSLSWSGEFGTRDDTACRSTESLNHQEKPSSSPDGSDVDNVTDLGDLDAQLDFQLEQLLSEGDQRIPDCIVESVMNEGDEMNVAFSGSIGQRVRKERASRRSDFDTKEPVDLVKDADRSDREKSKDEESEGGETARCEEKEEEVHTTFHFVGDWPIEGTLKQRQVRRRERQVMEREEGGAIEDENKKREMSGPGVTEFQKLLDLIQTGEVPVQSSSSPSQSLSPGSGAETEEEDEQGGSKSSSKGELPDCVQDRKAADSSISVDLRADECQRVQTNYLVSSITEGDRGELVEFKSDDSRLTSACSNKDGDPGSPDQVSIDVDLKDSPENSKESVAEADGSLVGETCESPACEGFAETLSSGGTLERKQRQGRRSGKQCKLALTFTQNCSTSLPTDPVLPNAPTETIDDNTNSVNPEVKPVCSTDCDSSPNHKPDLDLLSLSNSEGHSQLLAPLAPVETGCCTQTEPRDFALLWRLNRCAPSDSSAVAVSRHSSDVLEGHASRFEPQPCPVASAAAATQVPYRVVHERGTQVEEKELGVTQDRIGNLQILSRHFKLVRFDTLEDLYDKCHQDLDWTTNLLLDSGESFFREEDAGEQEEEVHGAAGVDPYTASLLCESFDTSKHPDASNQQTDTEDDAQRSTCGTENERAQNTQAFSGDASLPVTNEQHSDAVSDVETSPQIELFLPEAENDFQLNVSSDHKVTPEPGQEGGAWSGSTKQEDPRDEPKADIQDEMASMDEINRLLQAELEDIEREEKQRREQRCSQHLDIQTVELNLPTELALQLAELFGPVGVDPGTSSADDFAVQMDLNLAKQLHQKWKETIQERQRQETLSFHLLQQSSVSRRESQVTKHGPQESTHPAAFLTSKDRDVSGPEARGQMPFMDHWNVSRPNVSLRDIIKEEQALQENVKKTRQSRCDLDCRDGATLLKEKQLHSLFPTIDRHFLQDIFRDHNYNLIQTETFLRSLLNEEPVKTVVAPEAPRSEPPRAASKEREKRQKPLELVVASYQDTDDPEYEDFRAEASLQRKRQLESFAKAAEAYKQGRKEVASFYAQQGHLHGQRMREANYRAAVQIFERVNSSLLPRNILDLHGLHVDEALEHLAQVLQDKAADCEQGLCQPQLSVITGRGNHSQGGVARIRPAVIDYLTNKHYRFTEPKPGLVLVSLK